MRVPGVQITSGVSRMPGVRGNSGAVSGSQAISSNNGSGGARIIVDGVNRAVGAALDAAADKQRIDASLDEQQRRRAVAEGRKAQAEAEKAAYKERVRQSMQASTLYRQGLRDLRRKDISPEAGFEDYRKEVESLRNSARENLDPDTQYLFDKGTHAYTESALDGIYDRIKARDDKRDNVNFELSIKADIDDGADLPAESPGFAAARKSYIDKVTAKALSVGLADKAKEQFLQENMNVFHSERINRMLEAEDYAGAQAHLDKFGSEMTSSFVSDIKGKVELARTRSEAPKIAADILKVPDVIKQNEMIDNIKDPKLRDIVGHELNAQRSRKVEEGKLNDLEKKQEFATYVMKTGKLPASLKLESGETYFPDDKTYNQLKSALNRRDEADPDARRKIFELQSLSDAELAKKDAVGIAEKFGSEYRDEVYEIISKARRNVRTGKTKASKASSFKVDAHTGKAVGNIFKKHGKDNAAELMAVFMHTAEAQKLTDPLKQLQLAQTLSLKSQLDGSGYFHDTNTTIGQALIDPSRKYPLEEIDFPEKRFGKKPLDAHWDGENLLWIFNNGTKAININGQMGVAPPASRPDGVPMDAEWRPDIRLYVRDKNNVWNAKGVKGVRKASD